MAEASITAKPKPLLKRKKPKRSPPSEPSDSSDEYQSDAPCQPPAKGKRGKHQLTIAQLASYDDIVTDALVDHAFFCTTVPKNRTSYHPSRGIKEEEITKIIQEHLIIEPDLKMAEARLLKTAGLKKYCSSLKTQQEKDHFRAHLRRYMSIYLPDCPFEVDSTNRYTIFTQEASVTARRYIKRNQTIKHLSGIRVLITPEEEKDIVSRQKDFSIIISSRNKSPSLFMGPARFANHDCDANAQLVTRSGAAVEVIACRDIGVGEEITVTYSESYFGVDNQDCLCSTCEKRLVNGWKPADGTGLPPAPIEKNSAAAEGYSFRRRRREGSIGDFSRSPSVTPGLRPRVRRTLKGVKPNVASATHDAASIQSRPFRADPSCKRGLNGLSSPPATPEAKRPRMTPFEAPTPLLLSASTSGTKLEEISSVRHCHESYKVQNSRTDLTMPFHESSGVSQEILSPKPTPIKSDISKLIECGVNDLSQGPEGRDSSLTVLQQSTIRETVEAVQDIDAAEAAYVDDRSQQDVSCTSGSSSAELDDGSTVSQLILEADKVERLAPDLLGLKEENSEARPKKEAHHNLSVSSDAARTNLGCRASRHKKPNREENMSRMERIDSEKDSPTRREDVILVSLRTLLPPSPTVSLYGSVKQKKPPTGGSGEIESQPPAKMGRFPDGAQQPASGLSATVADSQPEGRERREGDTSSVIQKRVHAQPDQDDGHPDPRNWADAGFDAVPKIDGYGSHLGLAGTQTGREPPEGDSMGFAEMVVSVKPLTAIATNLNEVVTALPLPKHIQPKASAQPKAKPQKKPLQRKFQPAITQAPRDRTPGDYRLTPVLLSQPDSAWITCSICTRAFVQHDAYYTKINCPRCERHSKLYGYQWPKTEPEGPWDKEERIRDHRTVHRYLSREAEAVARGRKPVVDKPTSHVLKRRQRAPMAETEEVSGEMDGLSVQFRFSHDFKREANTVMGPGTSRLSISSTSKPLEGSPRRSGRARKISRRAALMEQLS